jgi:hypothetical protein
MPAFHHTFEKRTNRQHLNVFLVALNAEIKFRRYLKKIQNDPPEVSLPNDVLNLMRLTEVLVDEIYWELKPGEGTGLTAEATPSRRNPERAARGDPARIFESLSEGIEDENARMTYGMAPMDIYGL